MVAAWVVSNIEEGSVHTNAGVATEVLQEENVLSNTMYSTCKVLDNPIS